MTKEEKQIYNEVVITPEEFEAELSKYVLKGRSVYSPVFREWPAEKIYGQPNADGTGMALAGYLKHRESLKKWVERRIRMRPVIEKRAKDVIREYKSLSIN